MFTVKGDFFYIYYSVSITHKIKPEINHISGKTLHKTLCSKCVFYRLVKIYL